MTRRFILILFTLLSVVAMGQTNQTHKQDLPNQPGAKLHDGTVYMVNSDMELDGNATGGFINGLEVAENSAVTLYIPSDVTLTVIGQNAVGTQGAGAGIYVPASSTLFITGEGTLVAKGGNAANGENGTNGGDGNVSGQTAHSGAGGDGGAGGGGAAAAIGGNGGNGGATTTGAISLDSRKGTGGANGIPNLPTSTEFNGKDGYSGSSMGNVYIYGNVTVKTTAGVAGTSGGAAGMHGTARSKNNKGENWGGGGGAGAGGGAGGGANSGIGGGGAGAGGGAAGGSGAADSKKENKFSSDVANAQGNGSSATGYGEGAVNGAICDDTAFPRDNGGVTTTEFLRFGGYGGSIGGKAGAQGGNGATYVESTADISEATIGNKIALIDVPTALNVSIKLNNQNDTPADYFTAVIGKPFPNVAVPARGNRGGYEFMGYYTQPNGQGIQIYKNNGEPTSATKLCDYVQDDSPVLYAHWVLMQYTINWSYEYYDGSQQKNVIVENAKRCKSATVTLRLNDGTKDFTMSVDPAESEKQASKTVVLRDLIAQGVITEEEFTKIISVQAVLL